MQLVNAVFPSLSRMASRRPRAWSSWYTMTRWQNQDKVRLLPSLWVSFFLLCFNYNCYHQGHLIEIGLFAPTVNVPRLRGLLNFLSAFYSSLISSTAVSCYYLMCLAAPLLLISCDPGNQINMLVSFRHNFNSDYTLPKDIGDPLIHTYLTLMLCFMFLWIKRVSLSAWSSFKSLFLPVFQVIG